MIGMYVKAGAPGSVILTVDEARLGQPQWVAVQAVGLSVRTITEAALKTGVYDCAEVTLGVRDAFKAKGAFEPRGLVSFREWTAADQRAFYAAKVAEVAKNGTVAGGK